MALTKCEECGGKISKKAQSCPHCGHISRTMMEERSLESLERKMEKNKEGVIFWGLVLVIMWVVLNFVVF
jgi:uncharacterized membrane protein YvbJ